MRFPSRASFLAAISAAGAAATLPSTARAQQTPLRVAGVFSDLFAEPFYAKESGAFAKYGFAVESTALVNAGAVAAAIAGGALQMGTGDLISGVNAIIAGVPIVLLAGGGLYNEVKDAGSTIIAVAASSAIKSPRELTGKSVGVPTLVGLTTACLKAWLPANGIDLSSVKLLEVPPPTALAALQRGTIDAALLSEPFVTFGKGQIRSVGNPFDVAANLAPNKEFCVSVWYASKPWIEQDQARARRALQAIYATAEWANTHRQATFDILVRDGKLNAEKARGMMRTTYATSLTPGLVEPVIQIAEQNKIFARHVTASDLIVKV
jgi:NitT/TauT family transport system substrate-binding protein